MAKYPQKTLKTIKKGDEFTLCGFTGMILGTYTVTAANKTSFKAEKADGTELIFSRKDGKQTNAANPKYANYAVDALSEEEVEAAKPANRKVKKAKPAAKKGKKAAPAPEPDEDENDLDEDDDEEEEAPPAKKKAASKKAPAKGKAKKAPKKAEPEDDEDEDWDDDEEWEDA